MFFLADLSADGIISILAAVGFLGVIFVIRVIVQIMKYIVAALIFGTAVFGFMKSKSSDGQNSTPGTAAYHSLP